MTAREQAREAAKALWSKGWNYRAEKSADAASDVWEPLLREVWEYRSRTTPQRVIDLVEKALNG